MTRRSDLTLAAPAHNCGYCRDRGLVSGMGKTVPCPKCLRRCYCLDVHRIALCTGGGCPNARLPQKRERT